MTLRVPFPAFYAGWRERRGGRAGDDRRAERHERDSSSPSEAKECFRDEDGISSSRGDVGTMADCQDRDSSSWSEGSSEEGAGVAGFKWREHLSSRSREDSASGRLLKSLSSEKDDRLVPSEPSVRDSVSSVGVAAWLSAGGARVGVLQRKVLVTTEAFSPSAGLAVIGTLSLLVVLGVMAALSPLVGLVMVREAALASSWAVAAAAASSCSRFHHRGVIGLCLSERMDHGSSGLAAGTGGGGINPPVHNEVLWLLDEAARSAG